MLLLNSADIYEEKFFCPLKDNHKELRLLRKCYKKNHSKKSNLESQNKMVSEKTLPISSIYGYCPIDHVLYVFFGDTNPEIPHIPITPLYLKSKDSLEKSNPRKYQCTRCTAKGSLTNIKYTVRGIPMTIRTAIVCDSCLLIYYFNGEDEFIPIISSYKPIKINYKQNKNVKRGSLK